MHDRQLGWANTRRLRHRRGAIAGEVDQGRVEPEGDEPALVRSALTRPGSWPPSSRPCSSRCAGRHRGRVRHRPDAHDDDRREHGREQEPRAAVEPRFRTMARSSGAEAERSIGERSRLRPCRIAGARAQRRFRSACASYERAPSCARPRPRPRARHPDALLGRVGGDIAPAVTGANPQPVPVAVRAQQLNDSDLRSFRSGSSSRRRRPRGTGRRSSWSPAVWRLELRVRAGPGSTTPSSRSATRTASSLVGFVRSIRLGEHAGRERRPVGASIGDAEADVVELAAHQQAPVPRAALPAVEHALGRLLSPWPRRVRDDLADAIPLDAPGVDDARQAARVGHHAGRGHLRGAIAGQVPTRPAWSRSGTRPRLVRSAFTQPRILRFHGAGRAGGDVGRVGNRARRRRDGWPRGRQRRRALTGWQDAAERAIGRSSCRRPGHRSRAWSGHSRPIPFSGAGVQRPNPRRTSPDATGPVLSDQPP